MLYVRHNFELMTLLIMNNELIQFYRHRLHAANVLSFKRTCLRSSFYCEALNIPLDPIKQTKQVDYFHNENQNMLPYGIQSNENSS